MDESRFQPVLNTFERCPRAFALDEFLAYLDDDADFSMLHGLLLSNGFLCARNELTSGGDGGLYFHASALTQAAVALAQRISELKLVRLSEGQFFKSLAGRLGVPADSLPQYIFTMLERVCLIAAGGRPGILAFPFSRLASKAAHEQSSLLWIAARSQGLAEMTAEQHDQASSAHLDLALSTLTLREREIVERRAGLGGAEQETLECLGTRIDLTRERVRQIEAIAVKQLAFHRDGSGLNMGLALYHDVLARGGSAIVRDEHARCARSAFLLGWFGLSVIRCSSLGTDLIGVTRSERDSLLGRQYFPDGLDDDAILSAVYEELGLPLLDTMYIAERLSESVHRRLRVGQRTYLALRHLGEPSHYSLVHQTYSELFPNHSTTEKAVHAALARQELGIVWIGIRGTYALSEWGYERPSEDLFASVARIVGEAYAATGRPVSIEFIRREMEELRSVVNPASVNVATWLNDAIRRVSSDTFVPASVAGVEADPFVQMIEGLVADADRDPPSR